MIDSHIDGKQLELMHEPAVERGGRQCLALHGYSGWSSVVYIRSVSVDSGLGDQRTDSLSLLPAYDIVSVHIASRLGDEGYAPNRRQLGSLRFEESARKVSRKSVRPFHIS